MLREICPNYEKLRIHESSPAKEQVRMLSNDCESYTCSYFYEDIPLGKPLKEGVNEN